ncbi:hypothetical protein O5964_28130, partial [Escherichia coli]|nr:hypothetical protein [Escherichia coli]
PGSGYNAVTGSNIAFFTGREPQRDKPTRYSALVEASTAYSQPSVTGTEKLSEA